jgi:ATP-dependent Clp protease, protease subunit
MPRKISKKSAAAPQNSVRRKRPAGKAFALQSDDLINDATRPEFDAIKRPSGARFEAFMAEDGSEAVIDLYDVIGSWETNARTFRNTLKSIDAAQITVRINSPGGSVFDAFAMYNDLRAHPARIRVEIVGLAASAASVVAMAGDTIAIAENGFLMIHNSWTIGIGNARDLTKVAGTLAKLDKQIGATYARRGGLDAADVAEMMDAETWLDSQDAIDMNLADEIIESVDASALAHDLSKCSKAPGVLVKASRAATPAAKPKPTQQAPSAPAATAPDWSQVYASLHRLIGVIQR